MLCQIMEQLWPKIGNIWSIYLLISLFLIILCVPNVTKYSYHDTGSVQLYSQHKGGVVSVLWEHVVSAHGSAMV